MSSTTAQQDAPFDWQDWPDASPIVGLSRHHFDGLHLGSGLSIETIKQAGFQTLSDPAEISRILNWDRPATTLGPCLKIPFRLLGGGVSDFTRIRPDSPRPDGKGGVVKYEQPANRSPRAYFPPNSIEAVCDPCQSIGLTEGEKKSLAATQAGCPCTGLCGVWSWQKPRPKDAKGRGTGERELIDDLVGITWKARHVWIAFDFDEYRNPTVNHARAELARVLTELGASVALVDLPPGPRGIDGTLSKNGIDDFVVRHGESAFRSIIERSLV